MFVLLFTFVFGGAIPLPGGGSYVEFLLPGIMVQTVMFATATTAVGMTDDIAKGSWIGSAPYRWHARPY